MAGAATNPGTMIAALCDITKGKKILDQIKNKIIIANHNSPNQIVFSGPVSDMEAVETVLRNEKIKFRRLPVSAAFHSSLMSDVCDPFLAYMKGIDFKKPVVPIYSNTTGKPHQNKPTKIREGLARQIDSPVQFVKQIESMYEAGVRTFIEVGSGSVLTSFVDKTLGNKSHSAINMDTKKEHGITGLWKAIGRLIIAGVTPDFTYLWKDYDPVSDPRKKEKPKFSVMLSGTNYGKPYPPPGGIDDYPKPNPPRPQTVDKEPKELNVAPEMLNHTATAESESQHPKQPVNPRTIGSSAIFSTHSAPTTQEVHHGMEKSVLPIHKRTISRDDSDWIKAFQDIQQQTTEAHTAYLKATADSHLSFLKAAESSNIAFSALLTGRPVVTVKDDSDLPVMRSDTRITIPEAEHQISAAPDFTMSTPPPETEPVAIHQVYMPQETSPALVSAATVPPDASGAVSPPVGIDFKEMLLDVVADKTGYPKEILSLEMDLEVDLGIDSIKRVEIFSTKTIRHQRRQSVDSGSGSGGHG